MDKTTHNQIRQVLMNELGLSREGIRAEMQAIVQETVEKHIARMNVETLMQSVISKAISTSIYGQGTAFKELVAKKVETAALAILRERLAEEIDIQIAPRGKSASAD